MTYPVPELPGLIYLVFVDAPTYKTTIANMEDVVMVTDAPAHQSKLVIQWVQENLKKNVTHLLVGFTSMRFLLQIMKEHQKLKIRLASFPTIIVRPCFISNVGAIFSIDLFRKLTGSDDHAYGAADYVAVGATLVVPQDFTYYYSKIPGVRFAPVT